MQDPAEQHRRYTVDEAADILGITPGAVRNRLSRSTLQSVREEGRVFVLLPDDIPRDTQRDTTGLQSANDALISSLEERIESLERQLEQANERDRENRRLLAAALERIPPQLEAPSEETPSETRESPVPKTEGEPPTPEEPPRPWWRRVFGG